MRIKYLGSHERTNERTNERRLPSWEYSAALHHGDCLKIMPGLPDASVNLVLADLPFGITDLAWDRRIPLEALWLEYRRLLAPRGAIVLFATQPFCTDLINAARPWFRYEWIWEKPVPSGFPTAHKAPMRRHENLLVFYPKLPHYRPPGLRKCESKKRSGRGATGCYSGGWKGRRATRITGWPQSILRHGHAIFGAREPCEKPLSLLTFLTRTYTRPGDVVMDNAMGLGSTGLAAVLCGRQFIGIELERERFQRARRRIAAAIMAAPPPTLPKRKDK
jgi:DNA modification methylase